MEEETTIEDDLGENKIRQLLATGITLDDIHLLNQIKTRKEIE